VATLPVASVLPGVSSTNSFVLQVDAYVANLIPLTGFRHNGAYPGNHLELAGFCLLNSSSAMCLEGAAASASTCNGTTNTGCYNGYLRFQDFTGGATSGWVYPTCCNGKTIMDLEGNWPVCNNMNGNSDKTGWWDQWVTLYVNYNYSKVGEVYVWAYIPWEHPNPNCSIANPYVSGWIEIARRPITTLHDWTTFQVSGKFSWTQAQFDNVKIAVQSACNMPAADADADGDVDMDDFGAFQRCFTGPAPLAGGYNPAMCHCFDRFPVGAPDNVIDNNDLQAFLSCARGAGLPAPPTCN
jgi:hypothetical protein